MGEPKIPVFVAVGFWFASALAVTSYTYIAFKETANGLESGAMTVAGTQNPLIASAGLLSTELSPRSTATKPLNRKKFEGSK